MHGFVRHLGDHRWIAPHGHPHAVAYARDASDGAGERVQGRALGARERERDLPRRDGDADRPVGRVGREEPRPAAGSMDLGQLPTAARHAVEEVDSGQGRDEGRRRGLQQLPP